MGQKIGKISSFIIVFFLCVQTALSAQGDKKYIVFLCEWANEESIQPLLERLAHTDNIKLTTVFSEKRAPTESLRELVKSGKIEVPLSLPAEPILPLLYHASISSPTPIEFAWPQDVWDIIARERETHDEQWRVFPRGLYLKNGLFSEELIPHVRKLQIQWVAVRPSEEFEDGAYIKENILMLIKNKRRFTSARACWESILASKAAVVVILFDEKNKLTPEFLSEFDGYLAAPDGFANIAVVTPAQLCDELQSFVPAAWDRSFNSDVSVWTQRPSLWYRLNEARKSIDEYKNSGFANVDMLNTLKEEIYQLYRFDLIDRIERRIDDTSEQLFQAGLSNIYRLINKSIPADIHTPLDYWQGPAAGEASSFDVKQTPYSVRFRNTHSASGEIHIRQLSVVLDKESVKYSVHLDSANPVWPFRIDIYMDLNNKRRAGLTDLLPETNAYLDPDDAWEFALRIEDNKATLYRSGRAKPKLIKEIHSKDSTSVIIPKSILRGNPLAWGYQAVALNQKVFSGPWYIQDFLHVDDKERQRILKKTSIHLPAIRAKTGAER